MMVIHSGTNDLTYKVNTLQKIRKVINAIKENDLNNEIEIVLSSVILRDDQDLEDEINKFNEKLENLCKGKGMRFIDNSNIKSSSLNRSKLHLNKSGTALLTKHFAKIINSDSLYRNIDGQVNNLTKGSSFIASNVSHLGNLRSKNPKNIIFSYININSIRNKFENLCDMVGNNVDVLSIAETKLDSSFPNAQFLLPAFQEPLRLDINHRSGVLLVYIKASLPSKILSKFKLPIDIQMIPFKMNLRKEKRLFVSIYKPPSQSNQYFLDLLGDLLDFYSQDYDNKVILGDFNLEPSNPSIISFMNNQNLFNLVKSNTCFKGEGSCIDLILTNRKYSFKNTCSFETGLSDHHHLIYFVIKQHLNLKNLKNRFIVTIQIFRPNVLRMILCPAFARKNTITQISRKNL